MTDKDILISDLNDISEILNNNGYGGWCATIQKAISMLKEQEETIKTQSKIIEVKQSQVTELVMKQLQIVRCKDCKHWDTGHSEECENSDSVCFHNGWCKPDWFYADGERKTDGHS